jgi:chromate transporter
VKQEQANRAPLATVTLLALRLGATAFGGPAAHIALLRHEVVERRTWLTEQQFLDLLGVTNLIPGPNSTEMVMHVGHERAGRRGLVAAGAAFILPAAAITLFLAWLYVRYGTTAEAEWLLYGIKPVVIAVVAQAVWALSRTAFSDRSAFVVGAAVVALYLLGGNEILLLFGGGLALLLLRRARNVLSERRALGITALPSSVTLFGAVAAAATGAVAFSQLRLFLTFLKIGSVLYGSGYVLIAFLRNDFVVRYGWLTEQQLLDAVAVGQVTPGPVFTTATFIGYVVGGTFGAALATIGIFLPAFLFVGLTHPLMKTLRARPILSQLLDGVNVAAVGLMAAVTVTLARDAVVDLWTALLAAASALVLIRWKINATWLVGCGAAFGALRWLIS